MKTVVHSSNGVVSKVSFEPETEKEKDAMEAKSKAPAEAAKAAKGRR